MTTDSTPTPAEPHSFEVRVAGPDDVHKHTDELAALRQANEINLAYRADCLKHPDPADHVLCLATVHRVGVEAPTMSREVRMAVMLAYGHLWHVDNEPMAPVPLYSPEKAAYEARRQLRDLLTKQERGEAINQVGGLIGRFGLSDSTDTDIPGIGSVK